MPPNEATIARKIMDAWILGKMPEPPETEGAEAAPVVRFDNVVGAVNGLAFGPVEGAADTAPKRVRR